MYRRHNGSSWVDIQNVKKHNGASWVECSWIRRHNGSSWVDVWPDGKIVASDISLTGLAEIPLRYRKIVPLDDTHILLFAPTSTTGVNQTITCQLLTITSTTAASITSTVNTPSVSISGYVARISNYKLFPVKVSSSKVIILAVMSSSSEDDPGLYIQQFTINISGSSITSITTSTISGRILTNFAGVNVYLAAFIGTGVIVPIIEGVSESWYYYYNDARINIDSSGGISYSGTGGGYVSRVSSRTVSDVSPGLYDCRDTRGGAVGISLNGVYSGAGLSERYTLTTSSASGLVSNTTNSYVDYVSQLDGIGWVVSNTSSASFFNSSGMKNQISLVHGNCAGVAMNSSKNRVLFLTMDAATTTNTTVYLENYSFNSSTGAVTLVDTISMTIPSGTISPTSRPTSGASFRPFTLMGCFNNYALLTYPYNGSTNAYNGVYIPNCKLIKF